VNATQKDELIRPILKGEKTPKKASEETGIPLSGLFTNMLDIFAPPDLRIGNQRIMVLVSSISSGF